MNPSNDEKVTRPEEQDKLALEASQKNRIDASEEEPDAGSEEKSAGS